MTTVVTRPNTIHSGASNYTETGAANLYSATNDDSDASYIRKSGSGTASVIVGFGTTSISATQTVRRVRLRARCSTPSNQGKLNLQLGTYGKSGSSKTNQNYFTSALAIRGLNAAQEFVGPWYSVSPTGSEWTQELIDAARIQVTEYRDSTDRGFVYELYVDVDKAEQPSVTVSNPTGTITTTALPDVAWTYSDTESEAQTYFEVKVFDAATYGAGSFDPANSTPNWSSGQVASTSNTATVGNYLSNGTYRCYVRVAKTVNGAPFWSTWAYSSFTITLSPPSTPTVTTSFDANNNRVFVTATGAAAVGYDSQTFEVQRSIDSGVNWTAVRNADELIPNGSYVATVYDYEAARGINVSYRARAIAVLGSDPVASVWSTTSTVAVANDGKWWIKGVALSSINMSNLRVLDGIDETQSEDAGIFRPIGRRDAVVVAGTLRGIDGDYRIVTQGEAEFAQLYDIVAHQGTLLVQDPFGGQKYVRVIQRDYGKTGAATAARRETKLGYVEVAG